MPEMRAPFYVSREELDFMRTCPGWARNNDGSLAALTPAQVALLQYRRTLPSSKRIIPAPSNTSTVPQTRPLSSESELEPTGGDRSSAKPLQSIDTYRVPKAVMQWAGIVAVYAMALGGVKYTAEYLGAPLPKHEIGIAGEAFFNGAIDTIVDPVETLFHHKPQG